MTSSSPPGPPPPARSPGGQFLRLLTGVQNTSALVFSVFLTVHLASPLAAAVGGISLADKTLLIGRDLYLPLEPVLVYAPLALHLSASLLKRTYLTIRTRLFPPLTTHLLTGYLLIPFLLPHILTHRTIPQSPLPPISSLSPSELNFEFVAYSLWTRPIASSIAYLGLVGLAVPHAVLGSMKIISWIRRLRAGTERAVVAESPRRTAADIPNLQKRKRSAGCMLSALLGVVAIGLGRLYVEGGNVGGFMARRYEAVFQQTAWSRFGLR